MTGKQANHPHPSPSCYSPSRTGGNSAGKPQEEEGEFWGSLWSGPVLRCEWPHEESRLHSLPGGDLAPGRKFQHETTFKELYPSKAGELAVRVETPGTHDLHSPSRAAQPAAGRWGFPPASWWQWSNPRRSLVAPDCATPRRPPGRQSKSELVPQKKHPPYEGVQPGLDIEAEPERCVQAAAAIKRTLLNTFLVVFWWVFH